MLQSSEVLCLVDPLVDDGAMYSGIGEGQLNDFFGADNWRNSLESLAPRVAKTPFLDLMVRPVTAAHAPRAIIGSIMLAFKSLQGNLVDIRHLVIAGDSQWVVGSNGLSHCNNMHLDKHLAFADGTTIPSYYEKYFWCISSSDVILGSVTSLHCNAACLSATSQLEIQYRIVDKVDNFVCGHARARVIL